MGRRIAPRARRQLARWAATAGGLALPPDHLDELFLFEEKRKVQKDRTVSLRGVVYEVDASLASGKP